MVESYCEICGKFYVRISSHLSSRKHLEIAQYGRAGYEEIRQQRINETYMRNSTNALNRYYRVKGLI